MVYVFEFENFVKVGASNSPEARAKQFNPLSVWACECPNFVEAVAHYNLREFSLGNEFFYCDVQTAKEAVLSANYGAHYLGDVNGLRVMQEISTGFINIVDFLRAEPRQSFAYLLGKKGVRPLVEDIEHELGRPSHFNSRGSNSCAFAHPFLFMELCRSLSAKFKLHAISWAVDGGLRLAVDNLRAAPNYKVGGLK